MEICANVSSDGDFINLGLSFNDGFHPSLPDGCSYSAFVNYCRSPSRRDDRFSFDGHLHYELINSSNRDKFLLDTGTV